MDISGEFCEKLAKLGTFILWKKYKLRVLMLIEFLTNVKKSKEKDLGEIDSAFCIGNWTNEHP